MFGLHQTLKIWMLTLACAALCFGTAVAQDETADIEPGVDTTAAIDAAEAEEPSPGVETSPDSQRSVAAPRTVDSLELESTKVTGNQELPQVLYIVPWKSSDLGDLVGRPVNTLLDEVLAPADREVFVRQIQYYEDLQDTDSSE
ncbi:MAG: hypothetical protein AB8F65_02925 [Woeseiaceae bacterium]